ncbi:MAG: DUF2459 domain-containing protein [Rhodothermales bacterium]|nr:DUF2459 domain-containing protein [Rhodothermales bacterium]
MRRRLIGTAFGLLGLAAAFACGPAGPDVPPAASVVSRAAGEPVLPVWVVEHGWHAGIVMRAADLPPDRWPERADFPGAAYLEVGWGEAGYYPDPDPGVLDALRAGLWPTPSVLHVAGFARPPAAAFPHREVLRLAASEEGLAALVRFIHDAHAREGARAEPAGEGLYGESYFYAGAERYSAFRNCNTWVARALKEAGLPVKPGRALTVGGLMRQLRPLAAEAAREE